MAPAEIGGGNAFTPLWVGSLLSLPVLDGDTIGRAFPELQMSSCTLHDIAPSPAYIADALGNVVRLDVLDSLTIERFARALAVEMGARAFVAMYPMNQKQAQRAIIPKTYSLAIDLGKKKEIIPLYSGVVTDVDHKIEGGFLKGRAQIGEVTLIYQNEYLIAKREDKVIASTPDILMLVEQGTLEPVASSTLRYGLRVHLIQMDAPPIWKTEAGLKLVGKERFL